MLAISPRTWPSPIGTNLYAVPWTSTFRYYEHIDGSRRTRALNRLTKVFPPAELLPMAKSSRIDDLSR